MNAIILEDLHSHFVWERRVISGGEGVFGHLA